MRPARTLIVGSALSAALPAAACSSGSPVSPSAGQKVQHVDRAVRTEATAFTVAIPAGQLQLIAGPPGLVSLRGTVTYRGGQAPTLAWPDDITGLSLVSTCHSSQGGCGYNYTLAVPPAMAVTASNGAGNVSAGELAGTLRLTVGAGQVTLTRLSGTLSVTDSAGNVTATAMTSAITDVTVKAGNVSLQYDAAPQRLTVRDSTGNVTASVPRTASYHVDVSARTGVVSNRVPDDPTSQRTISLSVGAGNASLG